ncbi:MULTISPECIES: hypothetical protein [Cryobacterium]|uniref:hypothetical protein n=1 Tax=Cryobacterium TaxID=69578 RepID=UPI001F543A64|nr:MULTISPECIES: hypothetical protein [Cryobacterium]
MEGYEDFVAGAEVLLLAVAFAAGAELSFVGAADFSLEELEELEELEPASPDLVSDFVSDVFDERSRERFASDRASLL